MKITTLMLLTLLTISCQSQQKNTMEQDKEKFTLKDLVYLKSIPKDIVKVTFKKSLDDSETALNKTLFKQALYHNNTRILDPNNKLDAKILSNYNYSPWYTIEFITDYIRPNEIYTVNLFFGGLGFITMPNGNRGAILFDFSDLKREEERIVVELFKNIKNLSEKGINIEHKRVTYNKEEKTIKIENNYPHPSKEFSQHIGIFKYSVKYYNEEKLSFWRGTTQVQCTDPIYIKMMEDFIGATSYLVKRIGKYNSRMQLEKDLIYEFSDGLKIKLVNFTPRRILDKKATIFARLELSKNSEHTTVSIGKTTLKREDKDEFITTYTSENWNNYTIELKKLLDGKSIDIIVSKKRSNNNGSKNFMDITNKLSTDEFEQIKNFILKNKGRQTYRNYDNNNPHYAFIDFDLYLGADIGQKNMNNDTNISDFNELTIKHNILGAPIKYYELIIVRKGDIDNGKVRIQKGMEEGKVYLVDYYGNGLEKLKNRLSIFLETIRKRIE